MLVNKKEAKTRKRPVSRLLATIQVFVFSLTLFSVSMAKPSFAQFKSSYSNLPSATGRSLNRGTRRNYHRAPQRRGPKGVYPEFRSPHGVIRWIKGQMPLRVWVSNGEAIDSILDPRLGAPYVHAQNTNAWPDFVASLLENPNKLKSLPKTEGFLPQHRKAAIEGIAYWKQFEKEGLFSFQLTDNPLEADIHVFWVNHFVNKLGLALFSNDIRGYTAKRSFSYKAIMQGKRANFKPVVVILRATDKYGRPMSYAKMRAAAGHEMGHCLGIEGHSRNPNDLMSLYYGNGRISGNDAATIRYLYKITPDLIP